MQILLIVVVSAVTTIITKVLLTDRPQTSEQVNAAHTAVSIDPGLMMAILAIVVIAVAAYLLIVARIPLPKIFTKTRSEREQGNR